LVYAWEGLDLNGKEFFGAKALPLNCPVPPPAEYKVFLSLIMSQKEAEFCSTKTVNISLANMGYKGEMKFAPWPGTSYANIVLPYGENVNFTVSDGTNVDASLTWYHEDPRGDAWYKYLDSDSSFSFTATFDDEKSWFDLTPGHPWTAKFYYLDRGVMCVTEVDLQWDPPESNNSLQALNFSEIGNIMLSSTESEPQQLGLFLHK